MLIKDFNSDRDNNDKGWITVPRSKALYTIMLLIIIIVLFTIINSSHHVHKGGS